MLLKTLWRVLGYFRPYKAQLALSLGCAIASAAAGLLPPYFMKVALDGGIGGRDLRLLFLSVGGIFVAYVLRDVLNWLRLRFNNALEQRVILDMRTQLYNHLQRLSHRFFADRSTGELMSRATEDVTHVERVLLDGTEQVAVALLTLLGVATILFRMDSRLALVALIPIPFLLFAEVMYSQFMHRLYKGAREKSAALSTLLHDNLSGLPQIKIFGREAYESERFRQRADEYRHAQLKVMFFWAWWSPFTKFFGAFGGLLVLLAGGAMAITDAAGGMTVGKIVAFMNYLGLFYGPIDRLSDLKNLWQDAIASSERVFEILDTEPDVVDRPEARPLPTPVRGHVVFEGVSFHYDPRKPVLEGIDLEVRPGEALAIVGPTGAGKTTLVNLIPRFYDVTGGRVLVDGYDVREVTLASLRRHIAIVSQEPFLFNGTIRENILYGKPDATEAEMVAAARMANAEGFIARLPDGYDTVVGERGVKLSVGEKQRISIARAILKDAPILILDEATSSVDTITEVQIQEALQRLMANRTTFVIAHRLSTVREVDRIAVLQGGRIQELGTFAQLVEGDGLFARLWRAQSGTVRDVDVAAV